MMNDPKKREKFLREIGLFSISFSKLEDGVSELASFSIDDIRYWEVRYEEVYGLNLGVKRDLVKKFIKAELPELYPEWQEINTEIGELNHHRRHLIHGTGNSYLFREPMTTIIKNKNELEQVTYSIAEIRALTNRIGHVCSGDNGIQGNFSTKFKTAAINWHNSRKEPHQRIIYKVNNAIQTDWKGEEQKTKPNTLNKIHGQPFFATRNAPIGVSIVRVASTRRTARIRDLASTLATAFKKCLILFKRYKALRMTLEEIYKDKTLTELITVLENQAEYSSECIQIVQGEFDSREKSKEEVEKIARKVYSEKIKKLFGKAGLMESKVELLLSHLLSESESIRIYNEELENWRILKKPIGSTQFWG